jgi:phosphate transport system substrate-binding protein
MKKILITLSVAMLLAGLAQAEKLVIKGSDTLGAKLVPQLAEAFKAKKPSVTFEIAAEGSTTGIAAITDGTCDIAMSSRRAKPTEMATAAAKGVNMKPTIAAYDGIVVIVNKDNPVKELSKKQVEDIFTGAIADWSAVGGSGKISVYTRNTASGTYQDFKDLAMSKKDYAGSAQKMAGNEQIVAEVSKNAAGIGYVGLAYIKDPGIHVNSVGGVTASESTVKNKTYPYSRPTFFYTNGAPTGVAKDFLDFVQSLEGAAIVRQVGFVPVN